MPDANTNTTRNIALNGPGYKLISISTFSDTKTMNCLDILTNVQIIWGRGLILTRQNNQ